MTPLQIMMLIHYYARTDPYSKDDLRHATSPAVREQRVQLVDSGMLEVADVTPSEQSGYCVTPRGRAFVEHICALPLPECRWTVPEAKP